MKQGYKIIFIFTLNLFTLCVSAQMFDYKSIFAKPYQERVIDMGNIRVKLASTANKTIVDKEIGYIEQVAGEQHDKSIRKEALLIKMFCYNNNNWSTPEKNIENLQHTIKGIKSTDKNFYIKIYGLMLRAEIYWDKLIHPCL